jgi:phage baseplate assembly protein W
MKKQYSDLSLDFNPHPLTGDVVKLKGSEAIKRSLRNLIMTNNYEVPFSPTKGTHLLGSLFENFSPLTTEFLKAKIREMVDLHEPRVDIRGISIVQREDSHTLQVTITYSIIELNRVDELVVFVERTR